MGFVDRILTIVITATATSAAWIVFGGSLLENADSESQREATRPAEAAPSPSPTPTQTVGDLEPAEEPAAAIVAPNLDTDVADNPAQEEVRTLRIPVLNVRPSDLTDTYSDGMASDARLHEAIDIMAPEGTSVVAAAPGTVEKLFVSEAGGNTVYVRSQDRRTIHYYAHLGEYAEGLTEGQRIRRGQRLGTVGSTGHASDTAPHLHFAILRTTRDAQWWEPANAVNPYPLLTQQ